MIAHYICICVSTRRQHVLKKQCQKQYVYLHSSIIWGFESMAFIFIFAFKYNWRIQKHHLLYCSNCRPCIGLVYITNANVFASLQYVRRIIYECTFNYKPMHVQIFTFNIANASMPTSATYVHSKASWLKWLLKKGWQQHIISFHVFICINMRRPPMIL